MARAGFDVCARGFHTEILDVELSCSSGCLNVNGPIDKRNLMNLYNLSVMKSVFCVNFLFADIMC